MFYQQTIVIQIVMTIIVLAAMNFQEDSIDLIGLSFLPHPVQTVGLVSSCLLGWYIIHKYQFNHQKLKREIEKHAAIKFLFPITNREYFWSIGASFAAGICEEIVFRGFLYWQLAQFIALAPAILLTNLIFGLGHYATGFKNASIAFGLGILFSALFLLTNSLWIPILIHVLTDVYSMTKGKRYFDRLEDETIIT